MVTLFQEHQEVGVPQVLGAFGSLDLLFLGLLFFYFPFYQAFHMALIDTEDECKDGVKLLVSQANCENLPTYKICPLI